MEQAWEPYNKGRRQNREQQVNANTFQLWKEDIYSSPDSMSHVGK